MPNSGRFGRSVEGQGHDRPGLGHDPRRRLRVPVRSPSDNGQPEDTKALLRRGHGNPRRRRENPLAGDQFRRGPRFGTVGVAGSVATFSDITSQINQKKYLEQSLEDLQSKTRAANENASYLTTTLLSLVNEIAEANQCLVASLASGKGAPIESAMIVSLKAEKLKALLAQPHA